MTNIQNLTINRKIVDGLLGIRTHDRMMVGTHESPHLLLWNSQHCLDKWLRLIQTK